MTCQDFQHKWNELLDAEADGAGVAAPEGPRPVDPAETLLLAHAAGCPACRPIAAQYQTLRHAIRAWRQPPDPPVDLVQRILSAPAAPMPKPRPWLADRIPIRLVSGLAATVLVGMMLAMTLHRIRRQSGTDPAHPATETAARDRHSIQGPRQAPAALDRALAAATSATWDLARSASGPAARIGRDVLDATTPTGDRAAVRPLDSAAIERDGSLVRLSVSMPSLDHLASDAAEATTVLQQVGDRLSTGVGPLSNTARHAFGFLLAPPPARAASNRGEPTSSGA